MATPTTSAGLQPPPYVAALISAINDGAKAAQASALLLLLVGLYLLATAFSSTDEDLLLGKVMTISQIGASLPVTFGYAIAPTTSRHQGGGAGRFLMVSAEMLRIDGCATAGFRDSVSSAVAHDGR